MNMTMTSLRKEKGSVLVLTALSLVVLIGVAALAIDLSHAYVNKTRLQNLADSLALSAAISLNKQESSTSIPDKEEYAENYAKTITLPTFKAADGNSEVILGAAAFTFTFATNWSATAGNWQAANAINGARFARVEITTPMSIPTWFARIMSANFNNMAVSASAVAGATPIAPCDNVLPIFACAKKGNTDTDCSNGACFGYATNTVFCFKTSAGTDPNCPAVSSLYSGGVSGIKGNFGWMDVGSGGHSVNDCLAGDPTCVANFCNNNGAISSKPGVTASAFQGFNTRFDSYRGAYKSPSTGTTYYPDKIVGGMASSTVADNSTRSDGSSLTPAGPVLPPVQAIKETGLTATNLYKNYYNTTPPPASDANAADLPAARRRVLSAPFIDCSTITKNGGTFTAPASALKGYGCLFITQPMPNGASNQFIYAEITDSTCLSAGNSNSNTNTNIYKVILYKDPLGGVS
ncbi:MAG: TadE/TadG family type IV pilus assembly protein [Methylococcaceae bacterium]